MKKLKIVISAYACEPDLGSEQGVGWNYVLEIARTHSVWAITRLKNAKTIDPYLQKNKTPDIHWIYYDLPGWIPCSQRKDKLEFVYYYIWQIAVFFIARRLHRHVHFDLAHHITFVTYWLPSFLSLLPIPFVWGPIGGGEVVVPSFLTTFTHRARCFEYLRRVVQRICELDPFLRWTAQHADVIIATTPETRNRIEHITKKHCIVMSQVGISEPEFNQLCNTPIKLGRPFRILSAGVLTHFKNYHLALEAFAEITKKYPDSEYWLFGDGPEKDGLVALCQTLNIKKNVTFFGQVPRRLFLDNLVHCDVFLHPSLRESGGFAIVEALSAGRPVICLDLGGPGLQVNKQNGFSFPAISPLQVKTKIVEALDFLVQNEKVRQEMYYSAVKGIKADYLWSAKVKHIYRLYQVAVDNTVVEKE